MSTNDYSIGIDFVEKTKYPNLNKSDQMLGFPQPPLELEFDLSKHLIDLPDPKTTLIPKIELESAINNRKTVREYKKEALSLKEISFLLWSTQGVKEIMPGLVTKRIVPSAGARHPFETYLLINRVDSLKPGVYRYIATKHKLIEVNLEQDIADKITKSGLDQFFIKSCAVTFIWVAIPYRAKWRYNERGYRYIYLDAGHVCQNLYLSAEAINSGVCAIAAFNDDEMNEVMNLDGKNEFVIYMATVGKKL